MAGGEGSVPHPTTPCIAGGMAGSGVLVAVAPSFPALLRPPVPSSARWAAETSRGREAGQGAPSPTAGSPHPPHFPRLRSVLPVSRGEEARLHAPHISGRSRHSSHCLLYFSDNSLWVPDHHRSLTWLNHNSQSISVQALHVTSFPDLW